MIGVTHGGRLLTVVLYPTHDPADWHVATAWDATSAQRAAYHRHA